MIQREVAQLMVDLTHEQGAAAIMISHDLAMVAEFAQRVVVMERGRIVESGASEEILLAPRHPYTRRLLDALPRRAPARVLPPCTGAGDRDPRSRHRVSRPRRFFPQDAPPSARCKACRCR